MTVKEFASDHGITEQAVYQRIKRAGIDISTFKDSVSKTLTQQGIELLQKMFSKKSKQTDKFVQTKSTLENLQSSVQSKDKEIQELQQKVEELTQKCSELQAENDSLKDELATAKGRGEKLQKDLDTANSQVEDLNAQIDGVLNQCDDLAADRDYLRGQLTEANENLRAAQTLANNAQHLHAAVQHQLQSMIDYQNLPVFKKIVYRLTGKKPIGKLPEPEAYYEDEAAGASDQESDNQEQDQSEPS